MRILISLKCGYVSARHEAYRLAVSVFSLKVRVAW